MITKKRIESASYDHNLTIIGKECKGATIIINQEKVMISVDKENKLVHHEVINPKEVKYDWSLFLEYMD